MSASIWDNVTFVPLVNPAGNVLRQNFVATAGQTLFTLTLFSYTVGGNAINVYKNGLYQQTFTETSSNTVTLPACALNDAITIVGQVGITGSVTTVSDGSITNAKLNAGFVLPVGQGGTNSTTAAGARTALGAAESGANTSITSLASPAIGAATATTQAGNDSSTKVATTAQVQAAIALIPAQVGVPIGGVIQFAGSAPPTGYLTVPTTLTNISRTTFSALFAVIGTLFGAGDGSTTFGLPWITPDGTALQANSNVGTQSNGSIPSHVHQQQASSGGTGASLVPVYYNVGGGISGSHNEITANALSNPNSQTVLGAINTLAAGSGSTNLPAGSRFLHCIRYQ